MAAAQALTDAYSLAQASTQRSLTTADLQILHRALMENSQHGFDVLATAVYLSQRRAGRSCRARGRPG